MTDDDDDSFLPSPKSTPPGRGKGKRSVEDMLACCPGPIAQSCYALERIAGYEDGIAKVMSLCCPEAIALMIRQRPSLQRYAPAPEDDFPPDSERTMRADHDNDQAKDRRTEGKY